MFCTIKFTKKAALLSLLLIAALISGGFLLKAAVAESVCTDCTAISAMVNSDMQAEDKKTVYLTFDDGPSPVTEKILDVLKEKNVSATFFVIADENTKPYLPLLSRAEAEGHLIALHSATHSYKKIYKSADAFWEDIDELKEELKPFVSNIPNIFRFPGGSSNTVSRKYGPSGIMDTLKTQAVDKGYLYVDWNVCVNDAVGGKKNREDIVRAATKVGQKKTCIVLFHDSKVQKTTAAALPEIIDWYKEAGFEFSTVASLNAQKVSHE